MSVVRTEPVQRPERDRPEAAQPRVGAERRLFVAAATTRPSPHPAGSKLAKERRARFRAIPPDEA